MTLLHIIVQDIIYGLLAFLLSILNPKVPIIFENRKIVVKFLRNAILQRQSRKYRPNVRKLLGQGVFVLIFELEIGFTSH